MRTAIALALALFLGGSSLALAAEEVSAPKSLDELLERVREGGRADRAENDRREADFRAVKAEQERLLNEALAAKAAAEEKSAQLEKSFEENETKIPEMEETLRIRLGTLGELFGVVRQVAGDTRAFVESSLVSAQLPGRTDFLSELAQKRALPEIEDLERLWYLLLQEMTESGKVVRFPATVVAAGGSEAQRDVTRIGSFNVIADGRYLQYLSESGKLAELGRQPASHHLATLKRFEEATDGVVGVSIDPSRGSILSLLIQRPGLEERVRQGGPIGYVTIALGVVGLLLALERLIHLGFVGRRIRIQIGRPEADAGNPLGRILSVHERNRLADVETLELKLDEAILRETPKLERGNMMIKVISVVAPLLGLLGTVTGMIETFQAITLFGTGDPKLMAGGISEALVTTVLGLTVAIPLVLLHSLVSGRSKRLIQILEEQSAGIVASHAETLHAGAGHVAAG